MNLNQTAQKVTQMEDRENQTTQNVTHIEDHVNQTTQKITQIEKSLHQNTHENRRRNVSPFESAVVDQSLEIKRIQRDKIGLIQEELLEHGRQLDKHGRQIDDHDRQIDDHDRQIGDHFRQIDDHRRQINDHRRQINDHKRQIDHHKRQRDHHKRQIDDHARQTDDHTREIDDHGRQIDDHDRQIDDHDRQIDDHGNDIDDHGRRIDEESRPIQAQETKFKQEVADIKLHMPTYKAPLKSEHGRQIDDHRRQINDHWIQINDHWRQVNDHWRQIDHHRRQIDHHKRQKDHHVRQTDDHVKQIDDHGRQIDDHDRHIDDRGNDIDDLGRRIDEESRPIQAQETKFKQEVADIKLHMSTYKAPLKSGYNENFLCLDEMVRTCSLFVKKLLQDAKKEYEGTQMFLCRDSKDNAVIIGYDTTVSLSKIKIPDKYKGRLRIKHPKNISDEAFRASKYVLENKRNLDAEKQTIIQRCIKKHSSNLWKAHSNLTMISGDCVKYTGGIPKDTVCIVLYCLSKGFIPFEEDAFPTLLQENDYSIEVDVREGYFQFGPNNLIGLTNSWNDPVCMGSSIANEKVGKTGSVGPFVNLPNDEIGFLTCCHVLFDCIHLPSLDISYEEPHRGQICNDPPFVIQPSSSSAVCGRDIKEKRCGYVKKAIFKPETDQVSVDAALVKITNRIPNTGHFAISEYTEITETGYTRESPPMYTGGKIIRNIQSQDREKPVIKSGNKTGLTKGELRLNGLEVSIAEDGAFLGDTSYYTKRVMKGQYEVRSSMTFFDQGDSGSGVFLKDPDGSLKCIGIAIGRTSFYGTVVTPIGAVLQELGLEEKDMINFG